MNIVEYEPKYKKDDKNNIEIKITDIKIQLCPALTFFKGLSEIHYQNQIIS